MTKPQVLHEVRAQGGSELRCKGWKQEAILRMLENNMENAEDASRLVIYGGIGKCARNWESYHAIVRSLKELENDETLVVQSGMPVAVFRTNRLAPRVVMATTNIMKATWPVFYELQDQNLTMFAQYTAAPWEYIGTQGVIQGTFQTLVAIADQHFGGDLKGRILLTAGMGGMGGNQPRAMTMLGGVCICADVDIEVVRRRQRIGYCDVVVEDFDEALRLAREAARARRPLGIALVGNAVETLRRASQLNWKPDIITEMTPAHDPLAYIPDGLTVAEARALRRSDRADYLKRAARIDDRAPNANEPLSRSRGAGLRVRQSLRKEARDAGMPEPRR